MTNKVNTATTPQDQHIDAPKATTDRLLTRDGWKAIGFRVPSKASPAKIESYLVPGYRKVYRDRHLFSSEQVRMIAPGDKERRSTAAVRGIATRTKNMVEDMATVKLTIVRGYTDEQVYDLARSTHGGNYQGDPGEFVWSKKKARDAIRHQLTNYEALWSRTNRGMTGQAAYETLRSRVDQLVDEAYPQFGEDALEMC
jgi:hypothetical protein